MEAIPYLALISAVAAPLLAMEIGYSGVLVTGLAAYLCLAWVMPRGKGGKKVALGF